MDEKLVVDLVVKLARIDSANLTRSLDDVRAELKRLMGLQPDNNVRKALGELVRQLDEVQKKTTFTASQIEVLSRRTDQFINTAKKFASPVPYVRAFEQEVNKLYKSLERVDKKVALQSVDQIIATLRKAKAELPVVNPFAAAGQQGDPKLLAHYDSLINKTKEWGGSVQFANAQQEAINRNIKTFSTTATAAAVGTERLAQKTQLADAHVKMFNVHQKEQAAALKRTQVEVNRLLANLQKLMGVKAFTRTPAQLEQALAVFSKGKPEQVQRAIGGLVDDVRRLGTTSTFAETQTSKLQGSLGTLNQTAAQGKNIFTSLFGGFKIAFIFTLAYDAIRLLQQAIGGFFREIFSGIQKMEEFKLQAIEVAGILSIMASTVNKADFATFLNFAEGARERLEILGATALATGDEIFRGFLEVTERGVILETEEQFKDLLTAVNAVSLIASQTGRPVQQITSELRALLEGYSRPGAELVQVLRSINPEFLEQIRSLDSMQERWQLITDTLRPFQTVQDEIQNTLRGQLSILRTIFDIIERNAATSAYDNILDKLKEINESLFQGGQLTERGVKLVNLFATVWDVAYNGVLAVIELLAGIGDLFRNPVYDELPNAMDSTVDGVTRLFDIINRLFLVIRAITAQLRSWIAYIQAVNVGLKIAMILQNPGAFPTEILNIPMLISNMEKLVKEGQKFAKLSDDLEEEYLDLDNAIRVSNVHLKETVGQAEKISKLLAQAKEQSGNIEIQFDIVNPRADQLALNIVNAVKDRWIQERFDTILNLEAENKTNNEFVDKIIAGKVIEVDTNIVAKELGGIDLSSLDTSPVEILPDMFYNVEVGIRDAGAELIDLDEHVQFLEIVGDRATNVCAEGFAEMTRAAAQTAAESERVLNILRELGSLDFAVGARLLNQRLKIKLDSIAGLSPEQAKKKIDQLDALFEAEDQYVKDIADLQKKVDDSTISQDELNKAIQVTTIAYSTVGPVLLENLDLQERLKDRTTENTRATSKQETAIEKLRNELQKLDEAIADEDTKFFISMKNDLEDLLLLLKRAGVGQEVWNAALEKFNAAKVSEFTEDLRDNIRDVQDETFKMSETIRILSENPLIKKEDLDSMIEFATIQEEINRRLETAKKELPVEDYEKFVAQVEKYLDLLRILLPQQAEVNKEHNMLSDLVKDITDAYEDAGKTLEESQQRLKALNRAQAEGLPITEDVIKQLTERIVLEELLGKIIANNPNDTAGIQAIITAIKQLDAAFANEQVVKEALDKYERTMKIYQKLAEETADSIRDAFAEFFFKALEGDFDDFTDVWDNFLETLKKSFSEFIAFSISEFLGLGNLFAQGGQQKKTVEVDIDTKLPGGFGVQPTLSDGGVDTTIDDASNFLTNIPAIGPLFDKLGGVFTKISEGLASIQPILAAIVAAVTVIVSLFSIIKKLFAKPPRIDVEFDELRTETERRAALVEEFLDDSLVEDIIKVSVNRKSGVKSKYIIDEISNAIQGVIKEIQSIIFTLPAEVAKQLNDALLSTPVNISEQINGERLLEFDATGKKAAEKWEAFINGEVQTKFLLSISDFFVNAYESLGVLPEKAQEILDEQFAKFEAAGSREARAEQAQEIIAQFQAFVDVFNIASGNFEGSAANVINNIKNLSEQFGILDGNTIPTVTDVQELAKSLLEVGDITPETAEQLLELRNAIIDVNLAITQSISNLVTLIDDLNAKITDLGGSSIDVSGSLLDGIQQLRDLLDAGGLSVEERERILSQLKSMTDQWVAGQIEAQQAILDAQVESQRQAIESQISELEKQRQAIESQISELEKQRQAIESRISGLEKQKESIEETFQARIDALEEERDLAEDIQNLIKDIDKNIFDLLTGSQSPEGIFQRLARVDAEINSLFTDIVGATGADQVELGQRLQEVINQALDIAGEGFQVPSLEFRDQFRTTIERLEELKSLIGPTRTIEEITANIERLNQQMDATLKAIDSQIASLQNEMSAIDSQIASLRDEISAIDSQIASLRDEISAIGQQQAELTAEAAAIAREQYEYIRDEAVKLLEERLRQLEEIGVDGNSALSATEQLINTSNDLLVDIRDQITLAAQTLLNLQGYSSGGYIKSTGAQLAVLHGPEFVIPEAKMNEALSSLVGGYMPLSRLIAELSGTRPIIEETLSPQVSMRQSANTLSNLIGQYTPSRAEDGEGQGGGHIRDLVIQINGNVDSEERVEQLGNKFEELLARHMGFMTRNPKYRREWKLDG